MEQRIRNSLSLNEVFTLTGSLIKSCPSTNPKLPAQPFPTLSISSATPGKQFTLKSTTTGTTSAPLFVSFFTRLSQQLVPVKNGKVTIPTVLTRTVYAVITSSNTGVDDSNIVAGPTALNFPF
ncbi:hypothetical protein M422DRAFT_259218 [Sphaerobolus stellatus SS14]|uniref:Unplaced genomic scaffold SPHSTscaffold_88, whole genome shotgun sequence n=1 Tax=Sphaerobolus stellatus (strain SS14) TaxID=990650 RepID=A0A0C9VK35_SPHS4|nr:hypothetical protein M422DRAFT_259218 [Sphaerobolus stellatus SS14]